MSLPGGSEPPRALPPGQSLARGWPVLHYGPVPSPRPAIWDLRVYGATQSGQSTRWSTEEFAALPRVEVVADFHCVTKFSVIDRTWHGVPASAVLDLVPPAADATHVLVLAEYGYSASLPITDLADSSVLLATEVDGELLSAERGGPVRFVVPHRYAFKGPKWVRALEYLTSDQRGFWEERGYHNEADPWREQRYSYQESEDV